MTYFILCLNCNFFLNTIGKPFSHCPKCETLLIYDKKKEGKNESKRIFRK